MRVRGAVAAVIATLSLAVPTTAAAAQEGPVPGTTTPTPGERLQVLGETISRDGEASADEALTWLIAAAITAFAVGAAAGAAKAPGLRRRQV